MINMAIFKVVLRKIIKILKGYFFIIALFLVWIAIIVAPEGWSIIKRIEECSVLTSTIFIVMGWLWNSRENRKSVQQNIRLEYLANGFLKLLRRWHRDSGNPDNRKYIEGAEETMCSIQLYGNRVEMEAFKNFHEVSTGYSTVDEYNDSKSELLEVLRNNFRKELGLQDVTDVELRWWLDKSSTKKPKPKGKKKPKPKKSS